MPRFCPSFGFASIAPRRTYESNRNEISCQCAEKSEKGGALQNGGHGRGVYAWAHILSVFASIGGRTNRDGYEHLGPRSAAIRHAQKRGRLFFQRASLWPAEWRLENLDFGDFVLPSEQRRFGVNEIVVSGVPPVLYRYQELDLPLRDFTPCVGQQRAGFFFCDSRWRSRYIVDSNMVDGRDRVQYYPGQRQLARRFRARTVLSRSLTHSPTASCAAVHRLALFAEAHFWGSSS